MDEARGLTSDGPAFYNRSVSPKLPMTMPPLRLALLLVLSTTGSRASSAGNTRAALSILDFGGKAVPGHNNQAAIGKAMAACDAAGGCTLTFPRVGTASPPICPTPDCHGGTTYLTSAINLTSHLKLVVPAGVQLRGTEDFNFNCGGTDPKTCDNLDSQSWPVLPWAAYPAPCVPRVWVV